MIRKMFSLRRNNSVIVSYMKYLPGLIYFIPATILILSSGCNGSGTKSPAAGNAVSVQAEPAAVVLSREALLLMDDLKKSGDYVNSKEFPSLIKPSIVFGSLGQNIRIIDLRDKGAFYSGHIKGAVNIQFENLPSYFMKEIKPFESDKIIIVCEDGQKSAYTTSLLRLMGYGNVYAMRSGMSGWNKKYAEEGWLKGISGKYQDKLDQTDNAKPGKGNLPELKTNLSSGMEIRDERFRQIFAAGTGDVLISADEVFANPGNYFIINYERKDKYDSGHIPGAIRYKPDGTLGIPDEMLTIPVDKQVVVYCGTGHNSAFVTGYLRLLGYNAKTLRYGNQSFMYDRMVADKSTMSWQPFSLAEIEDYPVEKSK
jgi:rhodanese-related sulfurtransferase